MSASCARHLSSIEAGTAALIGAVTRTAQANSTEFLVIGAFARDIWLRHCHGIAPKRKTVDVDVALLVSGWEHYERFRSALVETEGFSECQDPDHPQRLYDPAGSALDLLPFGGVDEKRGHDLVIRWPTDGTEMSVLGFREAWSTAATFIVPHGTDRYELRVLTIPSLAALKLVAWSDRRHSALRRKHVADLYVILENYPTLTPSTVDSIQDWTGTWCIGKVRSGRRPVNCFSCPAAAVIIAISCKAPGIPTGWPRSPTAPAERWPATKPRPK